VTFTAERIVQSITRELGFRRKVYPRSVANGGMTYEQMQEEIAIFEQIKSDYAARAEAEKPQQKML
jgi:hypothetical protein